MSFDTPLPPNPPKIPLYQDSHFTFRFAEARKIPRFHLEGIAEGRPVCVFKMDPVTGKWLKPIATGTVGPDSWVDLPEAILVQAGEAFVVVPQ